MNGLVLVVKETHLSRKPARGSLWVSLASLGVLLSVSVVYWTDLRGAASWLPAEPESVFLRGEYWRLVTSIATHADPMHLLSNSVAFGVLSFLLYGYFGPWVYPAAVWALGSAVTALALSTYPPRTSLVGASGVVYLMAGFWLSLYLCVERRFKAPKRLFRAVGFALIVLVPTVWDPSVSYRSHAIGFVVGASAGLAYFTRKRQALRAREHVVWE